MINCQKQIPSINTLHAEKNVKELARQKIFTIVLNKCIDHITETNNFTDKTYVYFEVPNLIIGFPGYNRIACIHYLMQELKAAKYKVDFIDPIYLYIDWSTNTKSSRNLNNVPLQHIIPTSNPHKLKEQTRELLKKYPDTSKIVFEYADQTPATQKQNKIKNKIKK